MKITDKGIAVCEDDSHLSRWVEEQGRLDIQDTFCRLFVQHIPVGGVVVDAGACIGDHTLSYARMVGPTGRVHAFEPNPVAFQCLSHNMRPHHNVAVYRLALGAFQANASIANPGVPPYNLGATIIKPDPEGPIRIVQLDWVAKGWPRLDFLKIDVEGFELSVLSGAVETIKRHKPAILLEINRPLLAANGVVPEDIGILLNQLGYTVQPAEPNLSMDAETVDVLCLPNADFREPAK